MIISLSLINVNEFIIVRIGLIDIRFQLPLLIMNLSHSIIFIITFILYALPAMRTKNAETKLKGKFAFSFLVLFMIGNVLDAIIPWDKIPVNAEMILIIENLIALIARITLIVGVICLYNVFILPEWMKKRLSK